MFSIDYAKLFEMGFRGIIFDVDNTLVAHGADSTPGVDALLDDVHATGFSVVPLSNNDDDERLSRFTASNDTAYVCDAEKPSDVGYRKALDMLGLCREQVICVGDQVFADVLGANKAGIACILVNTSGIIKRMEGKAPHGGIPCAGPVARIARRQAHGRRRTRRRRRSALG